MFELFLRRNNKSILDEVNMFEKNFLNVFQKDFNSFFESSSMKTDIINNKDFYLIQAELPGFKKEDISIEIKDDELLISAKYEDNLEDKTENYIRKERRMNSYKRIFNISDIKQDLIEAKYENGILELKLPKKEEEKIPQTKKINIK